MLKRFTRFVLFAFLIGLMGLNLANAQKKYYILFDNMEDQKDHTGTEITNLIDICYWDFLYENPNYQDYIVRAPLSTSTLSKYDLTKMDVAIFILGKNKGLSHTQNGVKVFDKIKDMLAAGKRVAVIGSNVLSKDLGGTDQEVKDFWQNELGVDKYYTLNLGGTPPMVEPFEVQGVEQSISGGWPKYCNGIFGRNGVPEQAPIRWYTHAEFHTMKSGTDAIPIDRLINPSTIEGKTVYSGVQAEVGSGKIVVWTLNFDMAGVDVGHFQNSFNGAMRWFVDDIPYPTAFMRYSPTYVDFKVVNEEQEKTELITIKNYGKEPFDVTKIEPTDADYFNQAFELFDQNQLPVTLKTYETVSFRVKFAPKVKNIYETSVKITTTADNIKEAEIDIRGSGGIVEEFGPEITVSEFPMDYGTVISKSSNRLPLDILSSGNMLMIVNSIEFIENTDGAFFIYDAYELPTVVPPGDKYTLRISFFPETPGKVYKGRMKITSNALNEQHGTVYVDLLGQTAPSYKGPQVAFSTKVLEFGVVDGEKTMTVNLKNDGDRDLYFQTPQIDADAENLEVFTLETTEIPAIIPGESFDLNVTFSPKKPIEYYGDLLLTSNSLLYGVQRIPLGGWGSTTSVDENGFAGIDGLFEMKLTPNPVNSASTLEYTLNGNQQRKVELKILDATGKTVSTLNNSLVNPGTFQVNIEALNLANGVYVISAQIDKYNTSLNFVVSK